MKLLFVFALFCVLACTSASMVPDDPLYKPKPIEPATDAITSDGAFKRKRQIPSNAICDPFSSNHSACVLKCRANHHESTGLCIGAICVCSAGIRTTSTLWYISLASLIIYMNHIYAGSTHYHGLFP